VRFEPICVTPSVPVGRVAELPPGSSPNRVTRPPGRRHGGRNAPYDPTAEVIEPIDSLVQLLGECSRLRGRMRQSLRPIDDPLRENWSVDRRVTSGNRPAVQPVGPFLSGEFVGQAVCRIT